LLHTNLIKSHTQHQFFPVKNVNTVKFSCQTVTKQYAYLDFMVYLNQFNLLLMFSFFKAIDKFVRNLKLSSHKADLHRPSQPYIVNTPITYSRTFTPGGVNRSTSTSSFSGHMIMRGSITKHLTVLNNE